MSDQPMLQTDPTEQSIRDGQRIAAFVQDEAVQRAFKSAEKGFYRDWLDAMSVEGREIAHARTRALNEIKRQLQKIVNEGKAAENTLKRRSETRSGRP